MCFWAATDTMCDGVGYDHICNPQFWDTHPSMHENRRPAIACTGVDRSAVWEYSGSAIPVLGRTSAIVVRSVVRLRAGRAKEGYRVGNTLQDKTVVVVGRGGGIARAVSLLAQSEGARVIAAGRDQAKLARAYSGSDITAEVVDLTDDESI